MRPTSIHPHTFLYTLTDLDHEGCETADTLLAIAEDNFKSAKEKGHYSILS